MTPETITLQAGEQTPIVLPAQPVNIADLTRERNQLLALDLPDEIVSPMQYDHVVRSQGQYQEFLKRGAVPFDEVCNGAYRAWKFLCGVRDAFFGELGQKNDRARSLMSAYTQKQERIRLQEQERIRREEQQRLEDERAQKAKQLEKAGRKEDAAVVKNTPVQAAVTTLPSAVPPVQGLTYRDVWKWRPIAGDTPAGRKQAAQVVPREYCQLDDVALNGATRFKGTVKIPGIEFYCEKVPVRR